MTDDKLLEEIKKKGLLDEAGYNKVRKESLLSGRSAQEIIYEGRLVDDSKVAEIKSAVLKVPYLKINFDSFDNQILNLIPEETARTYKVVPLEEKGDLLVAGMVDPDDPKAQEALKFVARRAKKSLGVYLISFGDWEKVLKKYSPYKGNIEEALKSLNIKPGEGGRKLISLEGGGGVEDAPVIRIVADTLREAVKMESSDIHIEPQVNYLRVRFRIDGELKEVASLPSELASAVVSRVKVISNLKIDETRVPQDGRFRTKIFDREIDFRVSTFPTPLGEKVALRVLDPSTGIKSFDRLGLTGRNFEVVKNGLDKPFGMILITGPTGSGKTTTLYALLQYLNKENVNIVSLEDPVEYFISGINQSQIKPEIGYDFSSGLRQILRQDPDVIMVGEIRDNETAGLAVQAALTGHIVLSTLHTNNAVGVIPRLIDMKVEPFLLPVSLNLMLAQRLVGLLCDKCKVAQEASASIAKVIKQALSGVSEEIASRYKEPYKIYRAPGCDKCRGKGTIGRMAIFEVLEMTPAFEEIITTNPTVQKIMAEAKKQGMITLRQDGVLKALDGLISIEEVVRETEEVV